MWSKYCVISMFFFMSLVLKHGQTYENIEKGVTLLLTCQVLYKDVVGKML